MDVSFGPFYELVRCDANRVKEIYEALFVGIPSLGVFDGSPRKVYGLTCEDSFVDSIASQCLPLFNITRLRVLDLNKN
jgi:hypothetical protein